MTGINLSQDNLTLLPRPHEILDAFKAEIDGVTPSTFTEDAPALIVRASEGVLRRARNLCLGALLETVRDRSRSVDLKQVNRVLLQPHWREHKDAL